MVNYPMLRASLAVTLQPVYISSFAFDTPISLGNLYVPPAPGIIASPVSGRPIYVVAVAILISEHMLSSQPPPKANPSITEIVGQAIFSKLMNVVHIFLLKATTSSGVMSFRSFKSAPAQNIPGVELVKIIQLAF